ncbi:YchJ family protein [Candidatus Uabimicrobium sp. HlEnr_7]|uniref:YchJ family protein n=1 Tax=Candidatus Uabimicrobium helgolandensis TaxID=3095367 RepID=UPI0035583918
MGTTEQCPCQSKTAYADCCAPIIEKKKQADSAEVLMRSRYTAYVKSFAQHIIDTTHPDHRDDCDEESILAWSKGAKWSGLEIVNSSEGYVEFIAHFSEKGIQKQHHEKSTFKQIEGEWFFDEGKVMAMKVNKVGRNDPCSCGSGKKYKKCCGK